MTPVVKPRAARRGQMKLGAPVSIVRVSRVKPGRVRRPVNRVAPVGRDVAVIPVVPGDPRQRERGRVERPAGDGVPDEDQPRRLERDRILANALHRPGEVFVVRAGHRSGADVIGVRGVVILLRRGPDLARRHRQPAPVLIQDHGLLQRREIPIIMPTIIEPRAARGRQMQLRPAVRRVRVRHVQARRVRGAVDRVSPVRGPIPVIPVVPGDPRQRERGGVERPAGDGVPDEDQPRRLERDRILANALHRPGEVFVVRTGHDTGPDIIGMGGVVILLGRGPDPARSDRKRAPVSIQDRCLLKGGEVPVVIAGGDEV